MSLKKQYMLKFPPMPSINKDMSYSNSCISEYIGCHIFESIGIPTQKTLIGTYSKKRILDFALQKLNRIKS